MQGSAWLRQRCALALVAMLATPDVAAKNAGVHSPSGREIYDDHETFSQARTQTTRRLIIEVPTGLAPEGHLGILLGLINTPVDGLEFYSGVALELNPALSVPLSARYMFNFSGIRPYASAGYIFRHQSATLVNSHNLFFEVGHKWLIHQTYHFTLGVGLRRPVYVYLEHDSPLAAPDTDPALLAEAIDDSRVWVPTVALRFSHAF
jgi:hypothetical protein